MKTYKKFDTKDIITFSKRLRYNVIKTAFETNGMNAHIGGALSMCDIIAVLFKSIMNINTDNPLDPNRDRFILSKGHSVLSYYAALKEVGFISEDELANYEKKNSFLFGHPVKNPEKGIEFSTGSLGMGLSLGLGVALANQLKNNNSRVFIIIGDGECNEGSVWEAIMAVPKFKLNNIFVVVDKNNFQQTGSTNEIMPNNNLDRKWYEFGWDVKSIDGHNIKEIQESLCDNFVEGKPRAVIANTIKGKGVSFFENDNKWHHGLITKTDYEAAVKEIYPT